MNIRKNIKGVAAAALLLYLGIAGAVTFVGYEYKKIFMPNTHKAEIQKTDNQAQILAQQVADEKNKALAAFNADQKALNDLQDAYNKKQKQVTDAAGFIVGTSMALEGGDTLIATTFNNDAAATLDAPTNVQIETLKKAYLAMKADRDNIKAINDKLTIQSTQDRINTANALQKSVISDQAAKTAQDSAKLSIAQANSEAIAHAAAEKKLDETVVANKTLIQKIEALGLGSGVLLFILIPLLIIAFPEAAPFLKFITSPLLKLWHIVAAKAEAEWQKLHAAVSAELAKTQTQLASEQAAHASTTQTLIQVALTPNAPVGTPLPIIPPITATATTSVVTPTK